MKQLITELADQNIRIDWKPDLKNGVIIQSPRSGFAVKHYAVLDENGKCLYDTIGIIDNPGCCIVIVTDQFHNIGLLREYRPIPDKEFLSCVRGANENAWEVKDNAVKEIYEETGLSNITEVVILGEIYPNTTYFVNPISVLHAIVAMDEKDYLRGWKNHAEDISGFDFYTKQEVCNLIRENKLNCQMSLSALMLYFCTDIA